MVLCELVAPTSLGLRCVFNAFHMQKCCSGTQQWTKMTASAPRISRNSITRLSTAAGVSTVPSSCCTETTIVCDRRIVHIATQQWMDQCGQQQELVPKVGVSKSARRQNTPTICDIIAEQAAVPVSRAVDLVRFGAVYVGEVVGNTGSTSRKKRTSRGDGRKSNGETTAALSQAQRRKIDSKSAKQPPFVGTSFAHMRLRRLDSSEASTPPAPGAYLRVHCDPRTFPVARETDWKERVVAITDDYVVIDKPAGVPSVPTIDNALENALHEAELAVAEASSSARDDNSEHARPSLHAVSRLDVCTSGLIVFARSRPAAALLNQLFRDRRVDKRYLALLSPGPPVPVGSIVHCCRSKAFDGRSRPRLYARYDKELLEGNKWGGAWIEARSTVLLCAAATGQESAAIVARDLEKQEAEAGVGARPGIVSSSMTAAERLEMELLAGLDAPGSTFGAGLETVRQPDSSLTIPSVDNEEESREGSEQMKEPRPRAEGGVGGFATAAAAGGGSHDACPHICAIQLDTGRTHQLRLQLAAMGASIVGDTRYRDVVGRLHRGNPADDRVDIFGQEPEAIALQAARLEFEWRDHRVVYTAKRPSWALMENA